MTQSFNEYPQPVEDSDNAPYLQGWREGRLMLQQCTSCRATIFYPRSICPDCWSSDLVWFESSGRGELISYSLIMRPNHPAFNDEVPIVLAEIMLEEGVSMLARIIDGVPGTGVAVVLANDRQSVLRYPLPIFRPAP